METFAECNNRYSGGDGQMCMKVNGQCAVVDTVINEQECKPVFIPPVYKPIEDKTTGWWNIKRKRPTQIGGGTWECSDKAESALSLKVGECIFERVQVNCGRAPCEGTTKCTQVTKSNITSLNKVFNNGTWYNRVDRSSSCTKTKSGTCELQKAPVKTYCGNGKVEKGEQCDDGNKNDLDGCTTKCTISKVKPTFCSICNGKCARYDSTVQCTNYNLPEHEGKTCTDINGQCTLIDQGTITLPPTKSPTGGVDISLISNQRLWTEGEEVEVEVWISDGQQNVTGAEVQIHYLGETLEILDVVLTNNLPTTLAKPIYSNGKIKFSVGAELGSNGMDGKFKLATIKIMPKEKELNGEMIFWGTEMTSEDGGILLAGQNNFEYGIVSKDGDCGDMDGDGNGEITIQDFSSFSKMYNMKCTQSTPKSSCGGRDSNSDGKIDIFDFSKFAAVYKQSCSSN